MLLREHLLGLGREHSFTDWLNSSGLYSSKHCLISSKNRSLNALVELQVVGLETFEVLGLVLEEVCSVAVAALHRVLDRLLQARLVLAWTEGRIALEVIKIVNMREKNHLMRMLS